MSKISQMFSDHRKNKAYIEDKVERKLTDGKGYGLYAIKPIKKGAFICRGNSKIVSSYDGLTVTDEGQRYMDEHDLYLKEARRYFNDTHVHEGYSMNDLNTYAYRISGGHSLMPKDKNTMGWWTSNHACFPNCCLNERFNGCLQVLKDIEPGEEVTCFYGYHHSADHDVDIKPCLCGHVNCMGTIQIITQESSEVAQKWLNHLRAIDFLSADIINILIETIEKGPQTFPGPSYRVGRYFAAHWMAGENNEWFTAMWRDSKEDPFTIATRQIINDDGEREWDTYTDDSPEDVIMKSLDGFMQSRGGNYSKVLLQTANPERIKQILKESGMLAKLQWKKKVTT